MDTQIGIFAFDVSMAIHVINGNIIYAINGWPNLDN